MVTVLNQRRFQLEGLSVVVLKAPYAEALAVEAPLSIEAAKLATRFVKQGRSDGTLKPHGVLAVAFSGRAKADRLVVNELREACVYLVRDDLVDSAVDNALSFLGYVEAQMPEVRRVLGLARSSTPDPTRRQG